MNNHPPPADPGSQGRIAGILQWLGSHELPVLLAFCTILASLWGFAELAEEVMEGDTHEFDQAILLSMRNPADLSDPIGPGWVEEIGRDITAMGGNAAYIFSVDPVVKDQEYDITRIVLEVFPSEATDVYNKYKDAFAGRQIIPLNKVP